jgi:hypothetical protein
MDIDNFGPGLGTDSEDGTFSFWFNPASTGAVQGIYVHADTAGNGRFEVLYANTGTFQVVHTSPNLGGIRVNYITLATVSPSDTNWHHFICSWQFAATPLFEVYIDGVRDTPNGTFLTSPSQGLTEMTPNASAIVGAISALGTAQYRGCFSQFFIHDTVYADLTDANVLGAFRGPTGRPMDLGADGSAPLGSQPLVYLQGDHTGFNVNSGRGASWNANNNHTACGTAL